MRTAQLAILLAGLLVVATIAGADRTSSARSDADEVLSTELRLTMHGASGRLAAANCQLLVAADIVATASARSIGNSALDPAAVPPLQFRQANDIVYDNATARCDQPVGNITLNLTRADGWGAVPPSDAPSPPVANGWPMHRVLGTANTTAVLGDVASNNATLRITSGGGHSAASCQLLVAAAVVIVATSLASPPPGAPNATIASQPAPPPGESSASCSQHVNKAHIKLAG